jgi:hypothetical protein
LITPYYLLDAKVQSSLVMLDARVLPGLELTMVEPPSSLEAALLAPSTSSLGADLATRGAAVEARAARETSLEALDAEVEREAVVGRRTLEAEALGRETDAERRERAVREAILARGGVREGYKGEEG